MICDVIYSLIVLVEKLDFYETVLRVYYIFKVNLLNMRSYRFDRAQLVDIWWNMLRKFSKQIASSSNW